MSVHNDFAGPYLFIGGVADGQQRSVNASRDVWMIPLPVRASTSRYDYDPGDTMVEDRPQVYHKRMLRLGPEDGPTVTVMVWDGIPGPEAYRLALRYIAAMANGEDRV